MSYFIARSRYIRYLKIQNNVKTAASSKAEFELYNSIESVATIRALSVSQIGARLFASHMLVNHMTLPCLAVINSTLALCW